MTDAIICSAAFLLIFAVFEPVYLHLSYKEGAGLALGLTFKALATATALALALIGMCRQTDVFSILMVCGLSVCLAADILIGVNFLAGVAAFAVGHFFYIPAFVLLHGFRYYYSVPILVIGIALVFILFGRNLHKAGRLLIPSLLYFLVLDSMLACGIPAAFSGDPQGIVLAAGAALFVASDLTLARNKFLRKTRLSDTVSLSMYYAAQFLFALSVFIPVFRR